ncbi:hypothetical protein JTB14_023843 [Gonioctena quinquepunctata]|nr:hypothetical protein JTB14_023843 [Gonioctena quinquepunctata]
MSYEKEQSRLQKLMQELVSYENNLLFGDVYTSDEYHPESDDSSDSDSSLLSASFRKSKRMKMKETRSSDQEKHFVFHTHQLKKSSPEKTKDKIYRPNILLGMPGRSAKAPIEIYARHAANVDTCG